MRQSVKLVVLIPVGTISNKNRFEYMVDTIESIIHYTTPNRRIIIQDNSSPLHLGEKLRLIFPELIVVRAPENYLLGGGLYKAESLALLHIAAAYRFQVLFKMDTDAIMLGYGLEDDAIRFFEDHPDVGIMGNYFYDGVGAAWPRERLLYETSHLGWLENRKRCARLRYYLQMANANGYIPGEHVLGGMAIYNPRFIEKLVQGDFLLREELRQSKLQEDHLFGLLCKASGMHLASFSYPDYPFQVAWQELPAAPHELMERGVKAVHSTRQWNDLNEDQIREYFRMQRSAYAMGA
ncbi:MAG: glycosyltransferase [Chloroflexi bacterium]|nr:glycosyltransferase [Chloroflexota bacterium]